MTTAAFQAQLAAAGIAEGKPLHAVLLTVHGAAAAAFAAADRAQGLSPEAEEELLARIARDAGAAVDDGMRRIERRCLARMVLLGMLGGGVLLLTGYGAGWWFGTRASVHAVEGAAFLAQLAELNDVSALRRACERTAYRHHDRTACTLPALWVGVPPAR